MNELRETTWLVKRLARVGRTMGLLSRKKEPDWLRMGLLWAYFRERRNLIGYGWAYFGLTLAELTEDSKCEGREPIFEPHTQVNNTGNKYGKI